ncbi:MAG: cyclic nucleotide-binding domain-containing protein [Actinobacteria bacterium]|nr:MAG: cyclic nucleotide-binding domain-containing protein [Actinomycetota bacterium]
MDADRLKAIPLFQGLSKHQREQVSTWADEVDLEPGRHLVEQGEFAHEFFVIQEGTAEVTVDGNPVDALGPGDFFGEIALLETERRTASVVATAPLRCIVMHARDFSSMQRTMPEVAEQIHEEMRRRLADR